MLRQAGGGGIDGVRERRTEGEIPANPEWEVTMTSAASKSAGTGVRHAVLGLNAIDQMFFLPSYPF